jgi:hypothetical protein
LRIGLAARFTLVVSQSSPLYRFGLPEPAHLFASSLRSKFTLLKWHCSHVYLFLLLYICPQDIYDANALDLKKLGKSFGFSEPPHVPLDLTGTKRKKVKMDKAHKRFARAKVRACFDH